MAFNKETIRIPKFVEKKQIEAFFRAFYAQNKSVNFFFYLKCRAGEIKNEELKHFFISCALRYCNYASTGKCESSNPKTKKAHFERINRESLKKMMGLSRNKRLRRTLTDEDREKRAAYEKEQEQFRKNVRRRKGDHFIKMVSVPFGGMNKKY